MFTPLQTALGALLLHQASSTLLFNNGQILGASSIIAQSISGSGGEDVWLLAGMAVGAMLVRAVMPELVPTYGSEEWWWAALMAVMVGWGTRNAKGCTAGHMLCGLSRLSGRSAIATAIFFITVLITANLYPQPGITHCPTGPCYTVSNPYITETFTLIGITAGVFYVNVHIPNYLPAKSNRKAIIALLAGLEFSLGLVLSGMADPVKVLRFFSIRDLRGFDPSLALVMLCGVVPNLMMIKWRGFGRPPTFAEEFKLPKAKLEIVLIYTTAGILLRDKEVLAKILKEEEKRLEEIVAHGEIVINLDNSDDTDEWLMRTQWKEVFAGKNMSTLASIRQPAKEHEMALQWIEMLFDNTVKRAIETLKATPLEIRRWLKSPKAEDPHQKSFQLLHGQGIIKRYTGQYKEFLRYCFRTATMTELERVTEYGVLFSTPQLDAAKEIMEKHSQLPMLTVYKVPPNQVKETSYNSGSG
ncbi:hypothetical protein GP486_004619 [Trichoglossum hirsutum]|uniref:Sulphur transport domain-containing protein n=1 Tax=Trichoglossum hirsutum TaxID=265104 RepID=A0A9P8LAU7_9PEZI|nr:hypothetical protein GP486_004619 [Trichoglossum hirsutum]